MKVSLQRLIEEFLPPNGKREVDFSFFSLTRPVPSDLDELLSSYGAGTFKCSSGDWIELLLPSEATRDELAWICETRYELLSGHDWDEETTTIPKEFFKPKTGAVPANLILWGRSTNALYLMSIWLNDQIGWAVLLMNGSTSEFYCLFTTPSAILQEAFLGANLTAWFPSAEGPYEFEQAVE